MSFFQRDLADGRPSEEPCSIQSTETHIDVAERATVERRSVLWLSAGAVASLLAGTAPLRGQDPQDPVAPQDEAKPGFAEFLTQMLPQARRLVDSKGEDEEAYLMTVAAAMSRMGDPGSKLRATMRTFMSENRKEGERFPLAAMAIRLRPGGGFPHHDHLNYNGVIMGLEGEVRIRNYDFLGEVPPLDSTETFRIRETRDDLILPGRISTLGQKRENIHDVVAGKDGARVLDVFTFFERNATSRYLEVEDTPRDAEARIYDAAWKTRRRRG